MEQKIKFIMAHDDYEEVYGTKGHQAIVLGEVNSKLLNHRYIYLSKTIDKDDCPTPFSTEIHKVLAHLPWFTIYNLKGYEMNSIVPNQIRIINDLKEVDPELIETYKKVFPSPSEVEFYVQMLRNQYQNNK